MKAQAYAYILGEHISTGSVQMYLFHYLFKTESFDQNLLIYHKNSDLLRELLIIILWPKTQDKPMTSPRQDNLHKPNPRQDPRQTQDKKNTRYPCHGPPKTKPKTRISCICLVLG